MNRGTGSGRSGSQRKFFGARRVIMPGLVLAAILAACAGGVIRSAHAEEGEPPSRTTREGVFTDAQATRGKDAYTKNCASCHRDDLTGSADAVPLSGAAFIKSWDGLRVNDLFVVIHDAMPPDKPGTLTPEATADIISYILKFNKFPAGKSDFPNDTDALKDIGFTTLKD